MLTLKDLPVAVLCGGKGTRLGALTKDKPKILVEVAGRPFLHWLLKCLDSAGIGRVILFAGPHYVRIDDELIAIGREDIECIDDNGRAQYGTGGAIQDYIDYLPTEFAVVYGDSYLPTSWQPMIDAWNATPSKKRGCQVTLYGAKDWGFNIFHRRAFEEDWPKPYGLQRIFIREWQKQRLSFYHIDQPFYEMGSPEGLKELEAYLVAQQNLPATPRRARGPYRRRAARANGD